MVIREGMDLSKVKKRKTRENTDFDLVIEFLIIVGIKSQIEYLIPVSVSRIQ